MNMNISEEGGLYVHTYINIDVCVHIYIYICVINVIIYRFHLVNETLK